MKDVSLKGCKVHTLLIGKESLIRDMRIVGSVLTRLTLERTQLRDSRIKGSLVSDTVFADAELSSCDFRGTRFQGTEVRASRLKDCRFDGMGFRDLRMSGSTLRNVSFRETHSELPRVAEGLSIVDSTLGNIEFIGCAFRNTTIRGIKVEGLRLRGADLSDRTIEMVEDLRALAER